MIRATQNNRFTKKLYFNSNFVFQQLVWDGVHHNALTRYRPLLWLRKRLGQAEYSLPAGARGILALANPLYVRRMTMVCIGAIDFLRYSSHVET